MILDIRLSNFYSIKKEISLSICAENIKNQYALETTNTFSVDNHSVLKYIIIYGANESGKSNIIKAIRFCIGMVLNSQNYNENSVFGYRKFKFANYQEKPSTFFIKFINAGIVYEYSFSLLQDEIETEYLYYYPKGRKAKIFSRDERLKNSKKGIYTFGNVIKRAQDIVVNTSKKTLYISRASQMDRLIAKTVFMYFNTQFLLSYTTHNVNSIAYLFDTHKTKILEAFRIMNSEIVDINVRKTQSVIKNFISDISVSAKSVEYMIQNFLEIKTYHRTNPSIPFDFLTEESDGTKKLFFILLTVIDTIKNNKVLLIDEIEDSLHPEIISYIFNLFKAGHAAQLICTTHNTQFLDLKHTRKDQLYFANKKDDASTEFYSLFNYKNFRETMNLQKAYLQGRFDAIPRIDKSTKRLKFVLKA